MENPIRYKYKIQSAELLLPNKSPYTIDPIKISDIKIEKDFEVNFFPLFSFTLALSIDEYYMILENKTNIQMKLRFEYSKFDNNETELFTKLIFNDIFSFFIDENTPNFDKEIYNKQKEVENRGENGNLRDFSNSIELYLFKENDLNNSKKIINKVITRGTMLDSITYLLSSAGFRKVMLEPLDNNRIYNEILLPPTDVIKNLSYLENQYGFYNAYSTLFMDFDIAYLLSKKSGGGRVYKTNENRKTNLYIGSNSSPETVYSGGYTDTTSYNIYITKDAVQFNSTTMTDDQIRGTNTLLVNGKTGDVHDITSPSIAKGNGNYSVKVDLYDNPFMVEAIKMDNEGSYVAVINVSEFDYFAFTPNKEFMLIFEDNGIGKQYGGSYRLTKCNMNFKKEGATYSLNGTMVLKKRKKK